MSDLMQLFPACGGGLCLTWRDFGSGLMRQCIGRGMVSPVVRMS